MEIIISKDFIMNVINQIVKINSSEFLRKIFNLSTKISFENDAIMIRVLLFKYYIRIFKIPEQLSGVLEFEHNLPLSIINKEKLPKNIFIDKKRLYVYIPENIITKNLKIEKLSFDKELIILKLKIN
ncbi:MAG: hypothetical protein B6I29_04820 [Marinitoga sp. 4572_148]|nr:MAG: hypothetical protein B6I29_04820 [Marinitoga sp. 4572_148]